MKSKEIEHSNNNERHVKVKNLSEVKKITHKRSNKWHNHCINCIGKLPHYRKPEL